MVILNNLTYESTLCLHFSFAFIENVGSFFDNPSVERYSFSQVRFAVKAAKTPLIFELDLESLFILKYTKILQFAKKNVI